MPITNPALNAANLYIAAQATGDLLYASTATVWARRGIGTAGQVLTVAAGLPAWASSAALTKTDDTNVTLTLGGTPATALLQAVSLTLGWTGALAATRGGTAQSTYVLGDLIYASAADTLNKLAGNVTATRKFLRQTGTGAASAAPVWDTLLAADVPASALTKTDDTNVTLTLGGTPSASLLAATSLTIGWAGQLAVARGGTNASSFTAGSIIFAGAAGTILAQDNATLFWDTTSKMLGAGTASPEARLHVAGGDLYVDVSAGVTRRLGFRVGTANIPSGVEYDPASNILNIYSVNAVTVKSAGTVIAQFVQGEATIGLFGTGGAAMPTVMIQAQGNQSAAYLMQRDSSALIANRFVPVSAANSRLRQEFYLTQEATPTNYERLAIYPDATNNIFRLDAEMGGTGIRRSLVLQTTAGNVAIGTVAPSASTLLDLSSTTATLLIPRMTTTQKNALTAINGMVVYDTTLAKFQGYEAGAWASFI